MTVCTLCRKPVRIGSRARAALAAVGVGSAYTPSIGWCWPCWHAIIDKRPIFTEDECAEVGYVIADCPQCRADAHLPQREHATNTWYYCRSCGVEWHEDALARDWPQIIIGVATLAIIIGVVLAAITACAGYAIDHHWSQDGRMGAALAGVPLGIAVVMILSSLLHLLNRVTFAAYDYVWGPPMSSFEGRPRA